MSRQDEYCTYCGSDDWKHGECVDCGMPSLRQEIDELLVKIDLVRDRAKDLRYAANIYAPSALTADIISILNELDVMLEKIDE